MTLSVSATTTLENGKLTVSGEDLTVSAATVIRYENGKAPFSGTIGSWTESFSFSDSSLTCSDGLNRHIATGNVLLDGYYYEGYNHGGVSSRNSSAGYYIVVNRTRYIWSLSPTLYTLESYTVYRTSYSLKDPREIRYTPSTCKNCGRSVAWTYGSEYWGKTARDHTSSVASYTETTLQAAVFLSEVRIRNCTSMGTTVTGGPCTITGGTYKGSPAVNSNQITIERGTLIDTSGDSQFILGEDSEQTVTTSDGKTITTVKLSNPPVIIDWADFPG